MANHILNKKSVFLSLLLLVASCVAPSNQQEKPIEIRIVDLNGNPTSVRRFVPEGNRQALSNQTAAPANTNPTKNPAYEQQAPNSEELPPVAPPAQNLANITNSVAPAPAAQQSLPVVSVDENKEEAVVSYDMSGEAQPAAPATQPAKVQSQSSVDNAKAGTVAATSSAARKFKFISGSKDAPASSNKSPAKKSKSTSAKSIPAKGNTFVQIGAFSSEESANKVLNQNTNIFAGTVEATANGKSYRVLLGPVSNSHNAEQILKQVKNAGYKDAFIVK